MRKKRITQSKAHPDAVKHPAKKTREVSKKLIHMLEFFVLLLYLISFIPLDSSRRGNSLICVYICVIPRFSNVAAEERYFCTVSRACEIFDVV